MGIAARFILPVSLALAFILLAAAALAVEPASFRRRVGEAEMDWSAATVTAQGGAAASFRMPSPNAARPGAERRARAAAEEKLRAAAEALLGKPVDGKTVSERATVARIEYQSNGGVVLWLALSLFDVVASPAAPVVLRVPSMPFVVQPAVAADGKRITLGLATYRPAAQAPADAVVARERDGHLVLSGKDAKLVDSLAGRAVVIYLEKPRP